MHHISALPEKRTMLAHDKYRLSTRIHKNQWVSALLLLAHYLQKQSTGVFRLPCLRMTDTSTFCSLRISA